MLLPDEAEDLIEEICDNADAILARDISDDANDFAEGVRQTATSIGETIAAADDVTDRQERALTNMRDATLRWLRD